MAIALVMVQHMFQRTPKGQLLADDVVFALANRCWMGVDLFFVLSGFLITGILWRAKGQCHYFRNFYMRRTLRIFPAYYLLLAVFFVVLPLFAIPAVTEYLSDSRADAIWHWTYLSNLRIAWRGDWYNEHIPNVFWSLAIEEQFYLIWPAVVLLFSRTRMLIVCSLLFLTAVVFRWVLATQPDVTWVTSFVLPPARMDGLVLGSLLAILFQTNLRMSLSFRRLVQVVGIIALIGLAYLMSQRPTGWRDMPIQSLRFSAVALVSGALVWTCMASTDNSWLKRFFSLGVMRFLGKYSYSLYLWHGPADALVRHFYQPGPGLGGSSLPSQFVFILATFSVSISATLLSWHLLEKHCLRLKEKYA
ncbi:MAG: acyltransferase [bacterium]|nr:acyltransferase [bacterium]